MNSESNVQNHIETESVSIFDKPSDNENDTNNDTNNVTPNDNERPRVRIGRARKYLTNEEKEAAQRKNALLHYHRKKALDKRIRELKDIKEGEIIDVYVCFKSRVMGNYEEHIHYMLLDKANGTYNKVNI